MSIVKELTVFIDGNTKPLPSHGFYVVETGHLCVFVEHQVLNSQDLEWEALRTFLADKRFENAEHITIYTDNDLVARAVNAYRNGEMYPSDTVAEGEVWNKDIRKTAMFIVESLIRDRNITIKHITGNDNIVDNMLRKSIRQHYNLPSRWSHEEIYKPIY